MSQRIIIVDHHLGTRDDRATELLLARGYEIDWCRPGDGDPLPTPDSRYAAAIVHGGVENLSESRNVEYLNDEIRWTRRWVEADRPFVGFCLGGQLLARAFGASVQPHADRLYEIGYTEVEPSARAGDFLAAPAHMYEWHSEGFELAEGAELLATGQIFPNQAFRIGKHAYGLQFHPEVSPQNFQGWLRGSQPMETFPGAHSQQRQIDDAKRFDGPMGDWLSDFLNDWLGESTDVDQTLAG